MEKYLQDYMFNFFESDLEEVKSKNKLLMRKMTELMAETDFQGIEQIFDKYKTMRYQTQGYLEESTVENREKNMLANVGYTMALVDAMQLYQEKMYMQSEIQLVNTKYRDDLLRVLADRGPLLHKDLAIALGLSSSGLTAVIKQMNTRSVKLVNVQNISKYKVYSITAMALRYINRNLEPYTPKEVNLKPLVVKTKDVSWYMKPERRWLKIEETMDCIMVSNSNFNQKSIPLSRVRKSKRFEANNFKVGNEKLA